MSANEGRLLQHKETTKRICEYFFVNLRKKREKCPRLIFDSTSCQYGETLFKIRPFFSPSQLKCNSVCTESLKLRNYRGVYF